MQAPPELRSALGFPTRLLMRRKKSRLFASAQHCQQTQHQTLSRLLHLNAGSRFANEHRLSDSTSLAEFRRSIPITNYDQYSSYIEQMKLGDHSALLGPKNPLLMFAMSSGTTSASKYIPITREFLKDYRRSWQIWTVMTSDQHPNVKKHRILQLSSDHQRFFTDGGTPCGNISGLTAVAQGSVVRHLYTVPSDLCRIKDLDTKYYAIARFALADPEVGIAMTANPSSLIALAQFADKHKVDIIRDIADGSFKTKDATPPELLQHISQRAFKPNPRRAQQLEALIQQHGRLWPRDYWPMLDIVSVWTAASCISYLPTLRRYYGDVPLRDHGLAASEGRMTIPIADGCADGLLDISSHYFEFIPEDEYGSLNPTILEAHELEQNKCYYILLTTSSGFSRYDICDVVQCTGFVGNTPMLTFLHKGSHISSITGEKLSESQVIEAVQAAANRMQIHLHQFTMVPTWGEPPRYELMVERSDLPAQGVVDNFATTIDTTLQQQNCEYAEKRQSARLGALRIVPLMEDSWNRMATVRQSQAGSSVEQYKHPCLIPNMDDGTQLFADLMAEEFTPVDDKQTGTATGDATSLLRRS